MNGRPVSGLSVRSTVDSTVGLGIGEGVERGAAVGLGETTSVLVEEPALKSADS